MLEKAICATTGLFLPCFKAITTKKVVLASITYPLFNNSLLYELYESLSFPIINIYLYLLI